MTWWRRPLGGRTPAGRDTVVAGLLAVAGLGRIPLALLLNGGRLPESGWVVAAATVVSRPTAVAVHNERFPTPTASPPPGSTVPDPVPVLVITTFDLDEYVFAALRAGASGFLLKDTEPDEFVTAVRIVAAGNGLVAPAVTRRLIAEFVWVSTCRNRVAPTHWPSSPNGNERSSY